MPQLVDVEGIGQLEFPDDARDEEISAFLNREFPVSKKTAPVVPRSTPSLRAAFPEPPGMIPASLSGPQGFDISPPLPKPEVPDIYATEPIFAREAGALQVAATPPRPRGGPKDIEDIVAEFSPLKVVPFVSSGPEIKKAIEIYSAAKAIEAGADTDEDRKLVLDFNEDRKRDTTLGYKVANILIQLPAFAGELWATGGTYTAGKQVAERAALRAAERVLAGAAEKAAVKVAAKVVGAATGGAAQAPVAGALRMATSAVERATPQVDAAYDEDGNVVVRGTRAGEPWAQAVPRAYVDQFIETFTEHTGAGITGTLGAAARKLQLNRIPVPAKVAAFTDAARKWLTVNPSSDIGQMLATLKDRAQWHGWVGEIGEERLGEIMRPLLGTEEGYRPYGMNLQALTKDELRKGWEQAMAEGIAFAIPGVAAKGLSALGTTQRPDTTPRTSVDVPGTIDLSAIPITPVSELSAMSQAAIREEQAKRPNVPAGPAIRPDVASFRKVLDELGMTEAQYRALSEAPDVVPMPEAFAGNVTVGPSAIEGTGAFAGKAFAAGDTIGAPFIDRRRTPLGRYINHSASPNVTAVPVEGGIQFKAMRPIIAGEELTADYAQAEKIKAESLAAARKPEVLPPSEVRGSLETGLPHKQAEPGSTPGPATTPPITALRPEAERPPVEPTLVTMAPLPQTIPFGRVHELRQRSDADLIAVKPTKDGNDYLTKRYSTRKALETFLKSPGQWTALVKTEVEPNMLVYPAFESAAPAELPTVTPSATPELPTGKPQVETGIVDTIAGRMGLTEFEAKGYAPEQVTRQNWIDLQRAERRRLGQPEGGDNPRLPWAEYENYHEDAVKQALAKGEDVDPEVLKDYPKLTNPPTPAPEVKSVQSLEAKRLTGTPTTIGEMLSKSDKQELESEKVLYDNRLEQINRLTAQRNAAPPADKFALDRRIRALEKQNRESAKKTKGIWDRAARAFEAVREGATETVPTITEVKAEAPKAETAREVIRPMYEMTLKEALSFSPEQWIEAQKQDIENARYGEKNGMRKNSILVWNKSDAKQSRIYGEKVVKGMEKAVKEGKFEEFISNAHRRIIERLSKTGMELRPEVLADYPDLQKAAPPTPEGTVRESKGEVVGGFYSRINRTVEQSPQGKATGAQWKALIRNSKLGFPQAEWDYRMLASPNVLEDGTVYTRQEVLEFLKANEVTVKDVTLGDRAALQSELDDPNTTRDRADEIHIELDAAATHFSTYQLPGAKEGSYREVLLTVPNGIKPKVVLRQDKQTFAVDWGDNRPRGLYDTKAEAEARIAQEDVLKPYAGWHDGHFQYSDVVNPIVRLRFNERTTSDGKRMLFLEEVQAPQKGEFEKMPALFQKNWREIAFKWALRHAAENGFDAVGWTTGAQQAERYDLSKQLSRIEWQYNPENQRFFIAGFDRNTGGIAIEYDGIPKDSLEDYVGKEVAKQILSSEQVAKADEIKKNIGANGTVEGDNLRVGGSGLAKLYDTDFRNVVNNLPAVKKAGQKVGTAEIESETEKHLGSVEGQPVVSRQPSVEQVHFLTITPAIREAVMGGQAQFARGSTVQGPISEQDATRAVLEKLGVEELPSNVRFVENLGDLKGRVTYSKGQLPQIEISLAHHDTADSVKDTLVHELLHPTQDDPAMASAVRSVADLVQETDRARKAAIKYDANETTVEATNELIRRFYEEHANSNVFQRAVTQVVLAAKRLFGLTLTARQAAVFLVQDAVKNHVAASRGEGLSREEQPEVQPTRVQGVDMGILRAVEHVQPVIDNIKATIFDASQPISEAHTDKAWELFERFTNPATKLAASQEAINTLKAQAAPALILAELYQYGEKLALSGDITFLENLIPSYQEFALVEAGAGATALGRALHALGVKRPLIKQLFLVEKARAEAAGRKMGVGPDLMLQLLDALSNANFTAEDVEALIEQLPEEATEEKTVAQRQAEAYLDRLERSQTEWIKPEQRATVAQAIAEFIRTAPPLAESLFVDPLTDVLVGLGAAEPTARRLATEVYRREINRWGSQRSRQMARAALSRNVRPLIDALLSTPHRARNAEWRRQTAINWFLSNGLAREQAEVAAAMFDAQFSTALANAQEKAARKELKGEPATRLEEIITAIRAGVLDPAKDWMKVYAAKAGWRDVTPDQYRRLIELDDELANTKLSLPERALLVDQMNFIFRQMGLPPTLLTKLGTNFVVTFLTGFRTFTVNYAAPAMFMLSQSSLRSITNPTEISAIWKSLVSSYRNFLSEAKFSLTKDAYTFLHNEFQGATNVLKASWETGLKQMKDANPVVRSKGLANITFGSQQYNMRLLNAADQANMMSVREAMLTVYASEVMQMLGLGTAKLGMLTEAMSALKTQAYQEAVTAGADPNMATVIADAVAIEQIERWLANDAGLGETAAAKIVRGAELDAYSVVGRRGPKEGKPTEILSEFDEGGLLSRAIFNPLMNMVSGMRGKPGYGPAVAVSIFGYLNVPFRTTRFYAWATPWGLLRMGIHYWRKARGLDNWWKQSLATEYQERHQLKMAIAGSVAMAVVTGLGYGLMGLSSGPGAGDDSGVFITGSGPKNKQLRDAWSRQGFQPNSITLFMGKAAVRLPLDRVGEPLAHFFWMLAARDDRAWREKEASASGKPLNEGPGESTLRAIGTYLALTGQRGFLQQLTEIGKLGSQEGGQGKIVATKLAQTVSATFTPYLGLQNSIDRMFAAPVDRSSVESAVAAAFPVLGLFGDTFRKRQVNRLGDPLYDQSWFAKAVGTGVPIAFRVAPDADNLKAYKLLLDKGAAVPEARRYAWEEKYGPVSDSQFADYVSRSGRQIKARMLANMGELKSMTPVDFKKWLSKNAAEINQTAALASGVAVPSAVATASRTTSSRPSTRAASSSLFRAPRVRGASRIRRRSLMRQSRLRIPRLRRPRLTGRGRIRRRVKLYA